MVEAPFVQNKVSILVNSFYVQQQAFKYSLIRKTGYYVFPTTDLLTTRVPRGTLHPPPMLTILISTYVTAVTQFFVCLFFLRTAAGIQK